MTDFKELAAKVVEIALKMGLSDCDVAVTNSTYMSAEIEKGSMKQTSLVSDPGVSIRAFWRGSQGFSTCTGMDMKSIQKAARLAVSQAKAGTPDSDFKGLPDKARPSRVAGLYDPKLVRLQPDDVVGLAIRLAESASTSKFITSVNAGVGVGVGQVALANSSGFAGQQRFTTFEMTAEAVARSGSEMFSGMDGGWSRRYDPSLVDRVGMNAMDYGTKGLRHGKLKTGDYPVVLDPLSAGFILLSAIGGGANAESVQRKRTYLAGMLGKSIGSEALTVTDDPTIEWATGSYSFDGEGVPARRNKIVDKGVLKSYLYDSYTAGKDSVESTGNSSRGGALWSFRQLPSISPSNLLVKTGDSSLEEMISDTKSGVFLRVTYDYPNLATGEFSGLMMESFEIVHGELGPSIRQSTIGASLLDMFSKIDLVGKKSRYAFGVRTPAIRVSKVRIGGSS
jgi:PmbA protein